MTLDEAIEEHLKAAEFNDEIAEAFPHTYGHYKNYAPEHRQHAEWLQELKSLRTGLARCETIIKEFRQLLEAKEESNSKLMDLVARLTEESAKLSDTLELHKDLLQITTNQLAEAKRLLKAAVEDFNEVKSYLSEPYSRLCDKWRYENEALTLIGEDGEQNG